jgi:DNA-binding response OmpR family regulator
MTPTLPLDREPVFQASAGSPRQGPRPILLVEKSYTRAGELLGAIQRLGLPCVVALDPMMFRQWRENLKAAAVVLNLEVPWTRELGDLLTEEGLPVVALSDIRDERLAAIEHGYSDVFPASTSFDEIAARLSSRFGRANDEFLAPAEAPASGPLRVNVARRAAYWRGEEVELTPRLFSLAAYLAARPGVYVSIQTLLQEVWREGWANADKVHKGVSRLRLALGPGSSAFIRSKRGYYGYLPS